MRQARGAGRREWVLARRAQLTSIAAKSIGTVSPHRSASLIEPMCMADLLPASERSVKVICTTTSVIGSGIARTASLLKTDIPAEHSM